ncbi:MAG TPA: hypothetical protein VFH06_02510 [Candidatus Saccharimonadales bacterium]|nr:hypothetical protein [Candidatus Saccharimonadales bacterium]
MAKQKKKRNKQYTGANASIKQPSVTKLTAANRSPISQWWFEKQKFVKPALIAGGVAVIVVWLVIELLRAVGVFGR